MNYDLFKKRDCIRIYMNGTLPNTKINFAIRKINFKVSMCYSTISNKKGARFSGLPCFMQILR
jgi:hypothetical protein